MSQQSINCTLHILFEDASYILTALKNTYNIYCFVLIVYYIKDLIIVNW